MTGTYTSRSVLRHILAAAFLVIGIAASGCSRTERSKPDITIDDTMVFTESMTSLADGTVFMGSVKGIVFRALPGESHAKPWIMPTPENGLTTMLGVLADEASGTLWLCNQPGAFSGQPASEPASVIAFDLTTGERRGVYPLPPPASVCNDITIAKDGTAFVSDTRNGRIFTLAPGATELTFFDQDDALVGIDGVVFGGNGTLYANNVTKNTLLRIDIEADGSAGAITELELSEPISGPDGFRLIGGNRFVLAENMAGRLDEVMISGDKADIKVLKDGLNGPAAATATGGTAYVIEGKIGYLFDPKLKGQDPGPFKAHAVPLE